MTEALRHKIERFDRFQRQFARTRHRRSRDEFARNLAGLVERAQSGSRRRPAPAPPVDTPTDPDRAAFDQQVRDLLVRVHGRAPIPSAPDLPGSGHGDWWSPTPVYGFRVWQMIQATPSIGPSSGWRVWRNGWPSGELEGESETSSSPREAVGILGPIRGGSSPQPGTVGPR